MPKLTGVDFSLATADLTAVVCDVCLRIELLEKPPEGLVKVDIPEPLVALSFAVE